VASAAITAHGSRPRIEDVHFIARGAHLAALRTNGLKLISANGDIHLRSVQATDDTAMIGTADIVIFAVKQYDTETAAKLIAPLVGDETAAISIQNGMDPQERLKTIIGREHVMGGTTRAQRKKIRRACQECARRRHQVARGPRARAKRTAASRQSDYSTTGKLNQAHARGDGNRISLSSGLKNPNDFRSAPY
jgi:ketopantoate reductase